MRRVANGSMFDYLMLGGYRVPQVDTHRRQSAVPNRRRPSGKPIENRRANADGMSS
jgi:hypothetical protein